MNETKFEGFNLKPFIIEAVKDLGFYQPTEIQERIIPLVLKGESVIGQSQTGTGKTHSYLLPSLNKIDSRPSRSTSCHYCTNKRAGFTNLS